MVAMPSRPWHSTLAEEARPTPLPSVVGEERGGENSSILPLICPSRRSPCRTRISIACDSCTTHPTPKINLL